MKVVHTELSGVVIVEPTIHEDQRGRFLETYHSRRYREEAGIEFDFVQDNLVDSSRHVLRGLHLQVQHPQGKLVGVTAGVIWDVAVDVDPRSDSFGSWVGAELSANQGNQMFVPPGYAHGYVVLSDSARVYYKCTDLYAPGDQVGILWNDPELAIDWPVRAPVLSDSDKSNPSLAMYCETLGQGPGSGQ